MTEATTAIIARFSPLEWARAQALGFKIPENVREIVERARSPRRWSEARRMSEARKLCRQQGRAA